MSYHLTSTEYELMKRYIEGQWGIKIEPEKAYLIETRLSGILEKWGYSSFQQLYNALTVRKDQEIEENVIDAITTHETMWFRDKTPWMVLWDILLPEYVRQIREGQRSKVRIWSAGSSTGQEPYSIAMLIHRYLQQKGIKDIPRSCFEILATDISRKALKIAQAGKYDNIAISRGLDEYYKRRYFTKEDNTWLISEDIRNSVVFRRFNLKNTFLGLGKFDIIFCRYVTIYFSQELKAQVLDKITRALNRPGGVLFLGNSEVYAEYKEYYTREEHQGGVYYKIKEGIPWI
mgnify:CR=1 FL=1